MKIALFTETYLPYINGVVTHVKSLKDGLERAGHEVLVVTARAKIRHHYIEDGVLWCPAKEFKKYYSYGLASPVSVKRLRMIKDFNPDIIHIHNEFGVGVSGMSIARILRVPVVYTLHTMYDDYLYYIVPSVLIPFAKKFAHLYMKLFSDQAGSITGPSQKVQRYLDECGVAKEVNVVPNPVELDAFNPSCIDQAQVEQIKQRYQISPDHLMVCFCGRLGKEKSIDVMLDFFASEHNHDNKIKLMILGGGPEQEALEALAKKLNVADDVIFTGKIPHDELINYYACCQLYATTSLSDTNSISMLEAMATGLPVMHLYDELNAGQVVNGVNGFTFKTAAEFHRLLRDYRDYTDEQKNVLRHSVMQSVRKSGQENLANYLLDVYTHLEATKKHKKHVSIFELIYKNEENRP